MNYDCIFERCRYNTLLSTFIPIRPIPKQSFLMGHGRGYIPKRLVDYVKALKTHLQGVWQGPPFNDPVMIKFCFCVKFRKCDDTFKSKAPFMLNVSQVDLDNLTKPIQDAMQGLLFNNDKQVCLTNACKVRCEHEGTGIDVYQVNQVFGRK